MRFGFNLFSIDPAEFKDIAIACDDSGWDHLGLADAPFFPETVSVPYPHAADGKRFWNLADPVLDPWVAITHMATVTKQLRFLTSVLRMPTRKPLLEAKAACSVAAISDDRLAIGLGLGWMPEEYRFTNEAMTTRGARLTEAIQILRLCLQGGFVEFHGKYYDFDRLIMEPHPKTKIPIYVGGHAEAALRRAAEHADGWIGLVHPFEEARRYIDQLARLRAEFGREKEAFDIILQCPDATTIDGFRRLEDIGVTHTWVVPWHTPIAARATSSDEIDITVMYDGKPLLRAKVDAIKRYGDEVIAKFG
jgi:probable F420-dependent oxidoreductase